MNYFILIAETANNGLLKNAVYISYFSSVCKTPDLIRKCFSSLLPFCIYFTHTKPLFIATKLLTSHKIYWKCNLILFQLFLFTFTVIFLDFSISFSFFIFKYFECTITKYRAASCLLFSHFYCSLRIFFNSNNLENCNFFSCSNSDFCFI